MVTAALIAVIAIVGMVLVFTSKDKSGGTTSDGPGTGPTVTYDVDIDPAALSFGQVLLDFEAVMNGGSSAEGVLARWPALGVPGPFANGYAWRGAGMEWRVE